jgi:hypothetical protein
MNTEDEIAMATDMVKYYDERVLKSLMTIRHCVIHIRPIDKGWKIIVDSSTYYTINNDYEVTCLMHDRGLGGPTVRVNMEGAKKINYSINANGWTSSHKRAIDVLIERYEKNDRLVKQPKKKMTAKQKKIDEALGKIEKLKEQEAMSKLKFWEKPKNDR